MAQASDSGPVFFTKATPEQWSYVLSQYKEALKAKANLRTKKGGPEELIRLDTWYQEQLPKIIQSRKPALLKHDELIQLVRWKLMRGKFRPRLTDLVRINTETAVHNISKKAFRRPPKDLGAAITGLTNLKGIGPATASAILTAAFPDEVPYMADESMLSTPGIEATDYTIAEYLNFATHMKECSDRLKKLDPKENWTPHKVELTLWTHYIAQDLKPSILEGMPDPSDTKTENGAHPENEVVEQNGAAQLHSEENTNDSQPDSEKEVQSEENTNDSNVDLKENRMFADENTNDSYKEIPSEDSCSNDSSKPIPPSEDNTNDSSKPIQSEENTNDSHADSGKENLGVPVDLVDDDCAVGGGATTADKSEEPPAKRLCVEQ